MANYKRLFLNGYSYFITFVTYERNPILIDNIELLRQSFKHAKSKFVFDIKAITILPDHVHMIICVPDAKEYPKIMSTIKRYFSQKCDPYFYVNIQQSASREKQGYNPVWQKRFYEHTIRDEKDYLEKIKYIDENAVKHGLTDAIDQWEYCSINYRRCDHVIR